MLPWTVNNAGQIQRAGEAFDARPLGMDYVINGQLNIAPEKILSLHIRLVE